MTNRIDISVEFNGRQVDLRVPSEVTWQRLTVLVHHVFTGVKLPEHWVLALGDKSVHVDPTDVIEDLPIGSGDVLCIVPGQVEQDRP
ncbi:MAG: EsaB/YukD family protein [Bifidobacterium sp.]|jgi:hypothetical protein